MKRKKILPLLAGVLLAVSLFRLPLRWKTADLSLPAKIQPYLPATQKRRQEQQKERYRRYSRCRKYCRYYLI